MLMCILRRERAHSSFSGNQPLDARDTYTTPYHTTLRDAQGKASESAFHSIQLQPEYNRQTRTLSLISSCCKIKGSNDLDACR